MVDDGLHVGLIDIVEGVGRSEPLKSGRYKLVCGHRTFPSVQRDVVVLPDESTVVDFELPPYTECEVRFVRPQAGVDLDLALVLKDSAGRVLMTWDSAKWPANIEPKEVWWLAPGTYGLEVREQRGGSASTRVVVEPSGERTAVIEVDLRSGR